MELCEQFLAIKAEKAEIVRKYREKKDEILNRIDVPDEGQKTYQVGRFKIRPKGKVGRKVDFDVLKDMWEDLTEEQRRVFKKKWDVRKSELNNLEGIDPEGYRMVMRAIQESPRTPGLVVERIEGDS